MIRPLNLVRLSPRPNVHVRASIGRDVLDILAIGLLAFLVYVNVWLWCAV